MVWFNLFKWNIGRGISIRFLITNGKETSWSQEVCRQESQKKKSWDLLHLHLQSPQAGSPRHRSFQEGHEHHELLHPRHLRQNRHRGIQARPIQQEENPLIPGSPIRCQTHPPRRVGQTRRLRGNQGRHQIHPAMIIHPSKCIYFTINPFPKRMTFNKLYCSRSNQKIHQGQVCK